MARKVKCKDTGILTDKDNAYCVNCNGKNTYWSSEEAYKSHIRNLEYKNKCIDLMHEIFNYNPKKDILNTFFYKTLSEYSNIGYEVVYDTMVGEYNNIIRALSKVDFSKEPNDFRKTKYVLAIIQNNIMSYKPVESKVGTYYDNPIEIPEGIDMYSVGRKASSQRKNILGDL